MFLTILQTTILVLITKLVKLNTSNIGKMPFVMKLNSLLKLLAKLITVIY